MFGLRTRRLTLFSAVFCLALIKVSSLSAADIEKGKNIAARWCASCHLISPEQKKANAGVPSFAYINSKRRISQIKAYLIQSHPQMPNMSLTAVEIDNIIAYMQSLSLPRELLKPKPQKDKPPKQFRG